MAEAKRLDIAEVLQAGLLQEIKSTFTDQVINKMLEEFEQRLTETVKPIVEGITLEKIETMRNMLEMSEHLQIHLSWKAPSTTKQSD